MKLSLQSIANEKSLWESAAVKLPRFDIAAMRAQTEATPEWVHFGAGNIFRGFIGSLNQRLLNEGLAKTGIIACDTFDREVIEKIYDAYDSLTLNVLLNPDGTTTREVLAGVAKGIMIDDAAMPELEKIFRAPSLKMLSFTVTEKGYRVVPGSAMYFVAKLLKARFDAGALPMAVVSMDNCSHNGEKLMAAVLQCAEELFPGDAAFMEYLKDETKISFPWSMIDKITPRPHAKVLESLKADGFEAMDPVVTEKKTFIAPFVNAEKPQYLVVEDKFPNGRPPLEKAGVYFCDRATVNKSETMKVTTCLNPLHTAMSMYGCLLGYTLICEEMKDPDIVKLVKRLGYVEGLPVVVNPGILDPKRFIDEVVNERLPNPFMPDDPRRIATDTSQKVGIRFGETIKSYIREGRELGTLVAIPLAIAGWLRYLNGTFDDGTPLEVSADPLKEELMTKVREGNIREILANANIFGLDLTATPLAEKIEGYYAFLTSGPGTARALLQRELAD